jgi:small conductance mechanosensitive channel
MASLHTKLRVIALFLLIALAPTCRVSGQSDAAPPAAPPAVETPPPPDPRRDEPVEAPEKVDVLPGADDAAIAARLQRILNATEWFETPTVRVDEGVVFLSGATTSDTYRTWAGDLARRTEAVVAVVNRIQVSESSPWDLSPASLELRRLGRSAVQSAPLVGVALFVLLLTWWASRVATWMAGRVFHRRIQNPLLRSVATRTVAIPVFLLGIYLMLRISGLTQMAATVVGGTGLFGLIMGIAFRDIAENYLASILISMQRPFALGDLITVEGQTGFVQGVTTRGTLLLNLSGNHVQIPNATIYKAVILNLTANPKVRESFRIGVGYKDSIAQAQDVALKVLHDHPAVLPDPEPLVLVDELTAATVVLNIGFWVDRSAHSNAKVRSAVIRLVKLAFEQQGISMPDESREVVFPDGVPVRLLDQHAPTDGRAAHRRSPRPSPREERLPSTAAEGGLESEDSQIQDQAKDARCPEAGVNLLADQPPEPVGR